MANVLLVGDNKDRISGLKALLDGDGHRIAVAREVKSWREDERAASPEVVVASVGAPDAVFSVPMGGSRGFAPPILFVHRDHDEIREPHIEARLIDWMATPFAAEEFLGRVDALVRVRRVVMHQNRATEAGGSDETTRSRWSRALASMLPGRVKLQAKPVAPYLDVASRLAKWSDRRDGIEPGHAERVANFASMIADELGLPDGETSALLRAAMLHDIGKVALPIEVLREKRPLEENQIRLLRTHAERGAAILRALDKDDAAVDTILLHHENLDGSGYLGRKGDAIPRAARILAVAEAFDAMTTSLVRQRLTPDAAMGLMHARRGRHWDGDCIDALIGAMRPKPRSVLLG
jgi:two-component system response regulator RpfG